MSTEEPVVDFLDAPRNNRIQVKFSLSTLIRQTRANILWGSVPQPFVLYNMMVEYPGSQWGPTGDDDGFLWKHAILSTIVDDVGDRLQSIVQFRTDFHAEEVGSCSPCQRL